MPKLSVCIEMFWTDQPFASRLALVKEAGAPAFEFWDSSNKDVDAVRAAQAATGLALAGIVSEPGFSLTKFGNEREHLDGLRASAAVARSMGCNKMIVTAGDVVPGEAYAITRRRVVRKLQAMAALAADEGMTLCLEPLNVHVDHPGYWLNTMAQAADIVADVDSPHLKILYDIYHQQLTEGNLIRNLQRFAPLIGHIHVAQVPGRVELVGGEIDYASVFAAIDDSGYDGYVGLEFRSRMDNGDAIRQALALAA
ncbi:MAG: TIM barrel protein [Caldilineaceae bacterium]